MSQLRKVFSRFSLNQVVTRKKGTLPSILKDESMPIFLVAPFMHPIVTMHWYSLVCQHCSRDLEFIRTGQPSGTIWSRRLKYCKGSGLDNWNHLEPSFHLLPCLNAFSKYPILLTNRGGLKNLEN